MNGLFVDFKSFVQSDLGLSGPLIGNGGGSRGRGGPCNCSLKIRSPVAPIMLPYSDSPVL